MQEHDELTLSVLQRYHHISNVTESLVKDSQLDRVVELINQADRVYFFGIGSSGLVAREIKLRFMRLGVVCEALTDQDGFAWTTSYSRFLLFSHRLLIVRRHKLHYRQSSECERKGLNGSLWTANPAAIHQGLQKCYQPHPLLVVPMSIVSAADFTHPHRGRFNLCPFPNKSRETKGNCL